ncbi:MAG: hypothetical protein LUC22_02995 [Prevotella sp.]|nr:hypothetical protein [Prevotella sp.]
MKVIEALKINKPFLELCRSQGIRPADVDYIGLWNDYARMCGEGEKVSYAVACLAERYHLCERTVYALIKRLNADCTPDAV